MFTQDIVKLIIIMYARSRVDFKQLNRQEFIPTMDS